MPKPWKVPAPREWKKPKGHWVHADTGEPVDEATAVRLDAPFKLPSEMLRAAAAAYLDRQHANLWGRAYAVKDEDGEAALGFIVEVVNEVLEELSTSTSGK